MLFHKASGIGSAGERGAGVRRLSINRGRGRSQECRVIKGQSGVVAFCHPINRPTKFQRSHADLYPLRLVPIGFFGSAMFFLLTSVENEDQSSNEALVTL